MGERDEMSPGRHRRRSPENGTNVESILTALRMSDRPLSKAEILSTTGISEQSWPMLVRSLLGDGLIAQKGEKGERSTSYPDR